MAPLNQNILHRKLDYITECIADIRANIPKTLGDYSREKRTRFFLERLLQTMIEAAIDINNHIISSLEMQPAATYTESFEKLGKAGLLPESLTIEISRAGGMRNVLVHEYATINNEIVYNQLEPACQQFSRYCLAIQTWLEKAI